MQEYEAPAQFHVPVLLQPTVYEPVYPAVESEVVNDPPAEADILPVAEQDPQVSVPESVGQEGGGGLATHE